MERKGADMKKVFGYRKKEGNAEKMNPLNLVPNGEEGQKLIRFSRIDLVNGWVSDVSKISRMSQSQILEEIILQQFVPKSRLLQSVLDTLYSTEASVSDAVAAAISQLLEYRLGLTHLQEQLVSYKPLIEIITNRMSARGIFYDQKDFKNGPDPMYRWMRYFQGCASVVKEYVEVEDSNLIEGFFEENIKGWNEGKCEDWFCPLPVGLMVTPILKYWDFGLEDNRVGYGAMHAALQFIRQGGYQIFDIKDRLDVVAFINILDEQEDVR